MNSPLVSVNIPVFKCEKYILRCLKSVKNQTYKNLEIILVNDCTTDNSVQITEKFIQENPDLNIQLIHHSENQGLSVVRNTGIENSKGKYIFFLDSDDEITENCIEVLIDKALETDAQLIIAQNRWINTFDNSTKDFGFPTTSGKKYYSANYEIFTAYCNDEFPVPSWNKLFEADFIKKNKIYFIPGLYAQDELWFFHIMLQVETLAITDEITYLYYLHGDSVIFNRTKKNFENHQTIAEWFTKEYHKSNSKRKQLIKKKLIGFKDTTLRMQWKSMRNDENYWKQNYNRLKKSPKLSIGDYFSRDFTTKLKKMNLFQNLPVEIGFKVYKWRYERKF